ncbi:MAG: hypothetical protein WD971_06730 [Pirellulales bacterium]
MNSDEEAREVVERMATLRREIASDVDHVAESAKAMTDWTFYVRRFPWAAVGLAAAAGFLLVPRKKTTVTPTAEQLAALVNNKQFVAAATDQLKPPQSLLKGLAATLAAMAGRAALAYVTEQIRAKAAAAHREPTPTARAGNGARGEY